MGNVYQKKFPRKSGVTPSLEHLVFGLGKSKAKKNNALNNLGLGKSKAQKKALNNLNEKILNHGPGLHDRLHVASPFNSNLL